MLKQLDERPPVRKRSGLPVDVLERKILMLVDERALTLTDIANYLRIPPEVARKKLESLAEQGFIVNVDRGLFQRILERIGLKQTQPVPVSEEDILLTSTMKAYFTLHPVISVK